MNTETNIITVSGIEVTVDRKAIKNLHLAVYPPNGRVRVAVPLAVSDEAARLAIIDKLGWIKRQRTQFEEQPRQSEREMVTGESHYVQGRRYRLDVMEHNAPPEIHVRGNSILELRVRPGTSREKRESVLYEWYRQLLKAEIPPLIEKWEPIMDVDVLDWRVRKMKTKWGSCRIETGRIWLNLELAKKPHSCLEYIVVHEMVHLLERRHNDRFKAYMDRFIPQWRLYRDELNQAHLGHENWTY